MHFDQREQAALRDAGLSTDDLTAVSDAVAEAAREDAARLEAFFERETVYSDLDMAHSTDEVHEHDLDSLDLFTHSADLRGFLRFADWGAWVSDGRILRAGEDGPELVELTLGPTIHDRVRFAADPSEL